MSNKDNGKTAALNSPLKCHFKTQEPLKAAVVKIILKSTVDKN